MIRKSTKTPTPKKKPTRRKPLSRKPKKPTILDMQSTRHKELITKGIMISIDPSSGSEGSQPGYALFEQGVLKSIGVINIGTRRTSGLSNRLFLLRAFLEEEFDIPDIIIIERCPFAYANLAAARLQQTIGCLKSIWDIPSIEVSPSSWKRWIPVLPQALGIHYEKRDDHDAAAIGLCALGAAYKKGPEMFDDQEKLSPKFLTTKGDER